MRLGEIRRCGYEVHKFFCIKVLHLVGLGLLELVIQSHRLLIHLAQLV